MNSTEKLLKCIVCQECLENLLSHTCPKGHIHCDQCATTLGGTCGLCDLPMKSSVELKTVNEVDVKEIIAEINEAQALDIEELQNKFEFKCELEAKLAEIEKGQDCGDMEFEKKSDVITVTETKSKLIENPADAAAEAISETTTPPPKATINQINAETVGSTMFNTLKTLHTSICQRKCKTFDQCIHSLLLRIIKENTAASGTTPDSNIKGTESIMDLLETLHVQLCKKNCNDIENCLSQQLEDITKHYKTTSQFQTLTSEVKQETEKVFVADSNIVRSTFNTATDAKPMPAQFEFVNEFPKQGLKTFQQTSISDNTLIDFDELELIECPLPNCSTHCDLINMLQHLYEQHKQLKIERFSFGVCKSFFIDPSILEVHETDCLGCYFLPNFVQANKQFITLPIFLMVCRTSLSKIYGAPEELFAENENAAGTSLQTAKHKTQSLDAEIDEAIYGFNNKLKRKPVIWSNEDVLIIWPIAPIPHGMVIKSVLSVGLPDKPNCHRSVSFRMRSMQHSREAFDVFGASESLTLTNVEIEALTSQGEHAIQCQFMCHV